MKEILPHEIPYFISSIEDGREKEKILTRFINRLLKKHSVYCNNGDAVSVIFLGCRYFISGLVNPTNRVEDLGKALLKSYTNKTLQDKVHILEASINAVKETKPELSFYRRKVN